MTAGIIAAGHEATADAAARVMAAGGNAFDGVAAALCAACVAEPVLASLGGGGFLLARPAGGDPIVYDFFTQTPRTRRPTAQIEFFPIVADFGDATQQFHIGMGAVATPGAVAGLFAIQRDLCLLPPRELLAPARHLAERGVPINAFQHGIARIVAPILRVHPEVLALHASPRDPTRFAEVGERVPQPRLAAALEALAEEGAELFYRGDWARDLAADCAAHGGHLRLDDLAGYRVIRRRPLESGYRGARLFLNPPPSIGGLLIRLALDLLAQTAFDGIRHGSAGHRHLLASAMRLAQQARAEVATEAIQAGTLPGDLLARYHDLMREACVFRRGTTQISIADAAGNLASLTLSNGEGAGRLLGDTGIMLNNMLGEEDLSPRGFHRWPTNQRISSMMCPTLAQHADGGWSVTGSSGSNRIRSAILQVLSNLLDLGMPLQQAVDAPRLHYELGRLNLEPPVEPDALAALRAQWPDILTWRERSVFFGGAHSVAIGTDGALTGAGDGRRGGVVRRVD